MPKSITNQNRHPPELHAIAHGIIEELRIKCPEYHYTFSEPDCEISVEHLANNTICLIDLDDTIEVWTWKTDSINPGAITHKDFTQKATIEYANPNLIELIIATLKT